MYYPFLKELQFHKKKIFTYFFVKFKFIFCSKIMKTIQKIKTAMMFHAIPLNNVHIVMMFLTVQLNF